MTPRIVTVAETGSTNADLLALAEQGWDEGSWLRAERQTAGRGRQGRAWSSPAGNLYASTLVRLRAGDPPAATLALVAVVALEETVAALGAAPTIKWPNDVLLDGAKLSGILLERTGEAVVIGLGVNVADAPSVADRPATSLAAAGIAIGPAALLELLSDAFAAWLTRWRGQGVAAVRDAWCARAHPLGTPLVARLGDGGEVAGTFAGLDAGGALILRLADGGTRVIHAADVFLV